MAIISSLLSDASPPEARDRLKCNCKEGISKTNKFIQKVNRTTYLTLRNEEIIFIKYLITPNHLLHTLIGEIWKSSKKLSIDKSVKEVSISSVLSASTSCWISLDCYKVRRKKIEQKVINTCNSRKNIQTYTYYTKTYVNIWIKASTRNNCVQTQQNSKLTKWWATPKLETGYLLLHPKQTSE